MGKSLLCKDHPQAAGAAMHLLLAMQEEPSEEWRGADDLAGIISIWFALLSFVPSVKHFAVFLVKGRHLHLKKMLIEKNIVFEKCRFSANLLGKKPYKRRDWSLLSKVHVAEVQALKMNLRVCQMFDQRVSHPRHKMLIHNTQFLSSSLRTTRKKAN